MSKAFKPFNKSAGSSSDRTASLRRSTMYQAVVNSQNMNQLNNYQFTNRNFSVKPCQSVQTSSGQPYSELNQVSSYKTYMDLAIGKRLVNPVLNGQEALSLEGNMGAFYRLNVVANDSISTAQANNGQAPLPIVPGSYVKATVVDGSMNGLPIGGVGRISWPNASQDQVPVDYNQFVIGNGNSQSVYDNYPGYVIDPYNKLTNSCSEDDNSTGLLVNNIENIVVDARWLESYWGATGGQPLTGFSFPSQVVFGTQDTQYQDTIGSYKVAPMTQINQANTIALPEYDSAAFQNASIRNCNSSSGQNANVGATSSTT